MCDGRQKRTDQISASFACKIAQENRRNGNGVLLWFELDDFDAAVARAENLNAEIVMPRHRNPPDGNGGPNHWEVWLRDPDGYTVVLASPDGSADGNWRPAGLDK